MSESIADIAAWLKRLQDAAPAIRRAGLRDGETAARQGGFTAVADDRGVRVGFRGRRSMGQVPPAIDNGMLAEFNRRAK